MKRIFTIVVLLGLMFPSGCTKELETNNLEPYTTFLKQDDKKMPKNFIALVTSYQVNLLNTKRSKSYNVSAFAKFTNENDNKINVGDIRIGNSFIKADSENNYVSNPNISNSFFSVGQRDLFFGKSINIASNYEFLKISGKMRIPLEFFPENDIGNIKKSENIKDQTSTNILPIDTYSFPQGFVDKNSNLLLTWNADPNNEFGKVLIQVTYYSLLSKHADPNMPSDVQSIAYETEDDGFLLIPSSSFVNFPVGCYVKLTIARASTNNTGDVTYLSVVEASSIPLIVISNPLLTADFTLSTSYSYTNPCTFYCNASASGGVPPYTYTWYTSTGSNPSLILFDYGQNISGTGNCSQPENFQKSSNSQNKVPEEGPNTIFISLKVQDANLNTVLVKKKLVFSSIPL